MIKRLLLTALSAGSLFAYNHPCPDSWQLSGDFLYLMPTVDDTYFVINSAATNANNPIGTREHNDFSFAPGFRVGAEYSTCNPQREWQVFYSYLNTSHSRTVTGDFLWATMGRPDVTSSFENYTGTARAKGTLLYQHMDLQFSQVLLNSSGLCFYVTPGFELASLHLKDSYVYTITSSLNHADLTDKSHFAGVGPQMGFEVAYNLYETTAQPAQNGKANNKNCKPSSMTDAFSINAALSASLLASRGYADSFGSDTLSSTTTVRYDVTDQKTWRVIPALHARVGFNYSAHFDWGGVALGFGYEFNDYIRGVAKQVFADDIADGLCTTNYYNYDLQGLYVSGAISF